MDETQNTPQPAEIRPGRAPEDKVRADIQNWIQKVSQAHTELGGFSVCPYAKNAKYQILEVEIDQIYPIENMDVIIYVIKESDLKTIQKWVHHYNQKYTNWLFFEDCASYDTYISNIQTNNGQHNLILGQPKDKLYYFREILKKTEYYSYWSKEYYNEIVGD